MNLEKFTDRAKGFLQAAQTVAIRLSHQRISPEHILKALLEDKEGMASGLIQRAGGNPQFAVQEVDKALAKQPSVSGGGAQQTPGLDNDAVRVLDQAQVQLQQWLAQCDVLVMPTTLQRAFSFDTPTPADQADLTGYANFAGNPALSVPLAVADGELPLGLQLVGDIGAEMQLIALAEAFQQTICWQPSLPQACTNWWPQ